MSAALGRLWDSISLVCRGERPSSFDAGLKVVTSAELWDFAWDIQTAFNAVETYGTHPRSCSSRSHHSAREATFSVATRNGCRRRAFSIRSESPEAALFRREPSYAEFIVPDVRHGRHLQTFAWF